MRGGESRDGGELEHTQNNLRGGDTARGSEGAVIFHEDELLTWSGRRRDEIKMKMKMKKRGGGEGGGGTPSSLTACQEEVYSKQQWGEEKRRVLWDIETGLNRVGENSRRKRDRVIAD